MWKVCCCFVGANMIKVVMIFCIASLCIDMLAFLLGNAPKYSDEATG